MQNHEDFPFYYHERTKHDYYRYAAALGYLDWDCQPNPFRQFFDVPLVPLPIPEQVSDVAYSQLYAPEALPSQLVSLETISLLLFHSMAISAWKRYETVSWALRVNPSSGNLHPTETYLILGKYPYPQLKPGTYHYAAKEHVLECRTSFDEATWELLISDFPKETFFVGLSSIHWREAWKYGERAYRYCQHDVGHAIAAIIMAAAMLGWKTSLLTNLSDTEIAGLLGLDRSNEFLKEEMESPDVLIAIAPSFINTSVNKLLSKSAIELIKQGQWYGVANHLSPEHHEWDIIQAVAHACAKKETELSFLQTLPRYTRARFSHHDTKNHFVSASQIIRQRRSAVAMDGQTSLESTQFYDMLSRVSPSCVLTPWQSNPYSGYLHLGLFVHRVQGLPPGIYCLVRNEEKLDLIRSAMRPDFEWRVPQGCPRSLTLFLLMEKNVQALATSVSCGQDIAGEGVFSCGMLAEFRQPIIQYGSYFYRYLFWESGMIGQILYLEAEAKGIRSTGIGCFFDNPVHAVFGLKDNTFQSLYHFTVGGPIEDTRLTTLPAYSKH